MWPMLNFRSLKKKAWNQTPFILSVEYMTALKLLSVVLKKKKKKSEREREREREKKSNMAVIRHKVRVYGSDTPLCCQ